MVMMALPAVSILVGYHGQFHLHMF